MEDREKARKLIEVAKERDINEWTLELGASFSLKLNKELHLKIQQNNTSAEIYVEYANTNIFRYSEEHTEETLITDFYITLKEKYKEVLANEDSENTQKGNQILEELLK